MKTKFPLGLALVLSGIAWYGPAVRAQPGGGYTNRSLETQILEARAVFRGTIAFVSETVIHTNNEFMRQGAFPNLPARTFDLHNYTFKLRVDEILKGNLSRQPLEFAIDGVGKWGELQKWAEERASFLWFVKDSEQSIGTDFYAGVNFIFLGLPPSERIENPETYNFGRLYDMDFTLLKDGEDILRRARAFARQHVVTAPSHSIYIPELSTSDHFFSSSYLAVPVEPSLERAAKHLISAPNDFISRKDEPALVPQWRGDLRAEGVRALQYFKSAKNIRLLKSLLAAPDFRAFKDASAQYRDLDATKKIYFVRTAAYEVLTKWNVEIPKPILEETIIAKSSKP